MAYGEYLIRQGNSYYFRIKIPHHLRETIGKQELRKSLRDRNYREAKSVAQQLAAVTLRLFELIEERMDTLTKDDIERLLREWQRKTLKRDDDIRQQIESDLYGIDLWQHAANCDAVADQLLALLEVVSVPTADLAELKQTRPTFTKAQPSLPM